MKDPRGRRVRLLDNYYPEMFCRTGIITSEIINTGPYAYRVDLDNGESCFPYIPENGVYGPECEFIDQEDNQFITYLDERIQKLQESYDQCITATDRHPEKSDMYGMYKTMAANVYERIADHKQIKEEYLKHIEL